MKPIYNRSVTHLQKLILYFTHNKSIEEDKLKKLLDMIHTLQVKRRVKSVVLSEYNKDIASLVSRGMIDRMPRKRVYFRGYAMNVNLNDDDNEIIDILFKMEVLKPDGKSTTWEHINRVARSL